MITHRPWKGIGAVVCFLFLAGCAASIPVRKTLPDLPLSRSIASPAGWTDVTDKALSPDVEYWLLAGDRSASLLLREMQSHTAAGSIPSDESIITLAHISLRLKLAAIGNNMRITQAPALFERNPAFAVYSYAEKGLLRRVIVFRKRSRVFELELAQEIETEALSNHLAAQVTFAMSVVRE